MPKSLVPLTVQAPGFFGLNTQRSGSILPPGWATVLDNMIFDDIGRIASRKGSQQVNGTVIPSTPTVKSLHEYVDESNNRINIVAADNKIYTEVSGTMTNVSGTITTPTDDNWQFVNFNGWCVGFQDGHAPIVATSATSPTFADSGGTQYNGSMGLSAYGRLWTVLDNTLRYSDLLINNFTGGSSGNFDLSEYWPNGMDEAVALADFNGLLLVFGKNSIIVYENADDVGNMAIVEGVNGIGCIARDSVKVVGSDIVFLSNTGLRSLGRTLDQERLPLTDISQHVRDQLVTDALSETLLELGSVYNPDEGFYLLSFPVAGRSYYFDLKFPNDDGTWKVSTWDYAPTALLYTQDNIMYMGVDDGYVSKYQLLNDSVASDGSGGSTYVIDYEGVWNDFGEEVSNFLKIPKNVSVLASGLAGGDVTFKWALDYGNNFRTTALNFTAVAPGQFGLGQFGLSQFDSIGAFERVRSTLSSAGQVIKGGLTTTIDGNSFALQRFDILAKIGRLAL